MNKISLKEKRQSPIVKSILFNIVKLGLEAMNRNSPSLKFFVVILNSGFSGFAKGLFLDLIIYTRPSITDQQCR